MGKGKGKPGKGQNAPFSDAALEQRYQEAASGQMGLLVKILSAEPAMPDSLGTREVIGNPRQTCPIFTGRWRLLGPNPRPRPRYNVLLRLHHRSGANLIRMLAGLRSLPPASQVAQVEETSPAPVQAPQVLVPELQAAQPDTTQPMAGAGGDAPVPPSPAPVEGPTLEPAQASNLDSSSIQAAQSKAPEEAPPGTTAGTVETAQAEESSPAAKVPTEEVPLPSAQVEEASPTKTEPPSFLPFEFPDSSAPSLPHSEASPAQAKSATGEAEAPAHTSAKSPLSSSTDDSDTLEPVASPQDEESSPELKRELPEISSAQDPEDLSALYKEFLGHSESLQWGGQASQGHIQ